MIRGLYTSAWSMLADTKKMDVISNNLANVNTNAFKKDTVIFESFPAALTRRINDTRSSLNPSGKIGTMELGSDVGEVYTYYTQGAVTKTDSSLDMALQDINTDPSMKTKSTAFFAVGVPDGNGNLKECYTRDGAFVINSQNLLVTKDGYPVMGEGGPITLKGDDFSVDAGGMVIQNGETAGKLLIKQFTNTETLRKVGSNLVEKTGDTKEQAFTGMVRQGFLEQSNVNVIKEMVDMITVTRAYEANQKILQAQDGTLEKVVNEVGAVR